IQAESGARPNLSASFARWFDERPDLLEQNREPDGSLWLLPSPAAGFYRAAFSNADYPSSGASSGPRLSGFAINGWAEWAFQVDGNAPTFKWHLPPKRRAAVQQWLTSPMGPPPLQVVTKDVLSSPSATPDFQVPNQILADLVQAVDELHDGHTEQIETMRQAFLSRFPLDRWAALEGRELLHTMHARDNTDRLVYWLEFKHDDAFDSVRFGSIAGGSALKFRVFQRKDTGGWVTGHSKNMIDLSEAEAIAIAENQRDELVAAVSLAKDLPREPDDPRWRELGAAMLTAAPHNGHLAFFHKLVHLYVPERIDAFHSAAYQQQALARCGLVAPGASLWHAPQLFHAVRLQVQRGRAEETTLNELMTIMNALFGGVRGHWRVGTGNDGEYWPAFEERSIVAIGWEQLGNLEDVIAGKQGREGVDALKQALRETYPESSPQQIGKSASQIWCFYGRIQPNDWVYVAKGQRVLAVGEVVGDPFDAVDDLRYRSRRRVRWLTTSPFKAPTKTGLRSTVYNFSNALNIQAAAARTIAAPAIDEPNKSMLGLLRAHKGDAKAPPQHAPNLPPPSALARQVEEKGQVIFYGPPGTGKTYHALRVAEELAARNRNKATFGELTPDERAGIRGTGNKDARRIWSCTFHPAYGYEDFVEGLRPVPISGGLDFKPQPGLFLRICAQALEAPNEAHILIIDEFNRGDAARIFGELLTLIEMNKRRGASAATVSLPYSDDTFSVPPNVYMLATMNTADRSISLLDAALRRRFRFVEFMPQPSLLSSRPIQGLNLGAMLTEINQRLMAQLGDTARNLQVGHSYFMNERGQPLQSVESLASALRYDVFPLLQEYCADDPNTLGAVLGKDFFDRTTQRFRDEPFQPGQASMLISALIAWNPDALQADDPTALDDEADDVDEGNEEAIDDADGADEELA
ncbi:MAG: AAA family ATPase, partial [Myxococcota bacterium]